MLIAELLVAQNEELSEKLLTEFDGKDLMIKMILESYGMHSKTILDASNW